MSDQILGARGGIVPVAEGASSPYLRAGRQNELITSDGKGRYTEGARQGKIFHLMLAAWTSTIAAGNIVGAAAAASTQFALWNPPNSGILISLLKFAVWPISGTAPLPPVSHSYSSTAPTIASAAVTPVVCGNLSSNAPAAGYLTSAAGAALTGSAILKYIRAADLFITAGTAANLQGMKTVEYIDGDIVLSANTCWVPTWPAAGTTFLGGYSITWEEIPL